jgi:hypothetical protein
MSLRLVMPSRPRWRTSTLDTSTNEQLVLPISWKWRPIAIPEALKTPSAFYSDSFPEALKTPSAPDSSPFASQKSDRLQAEE